MKAFSCILLLTFLLIQCKPKKNDTIIQFAGKPEIPSSIKKEHEYLLSEIGKLAQMEDSTGRAAIKLNELMRHHFAEEEDYVLPPLGLLTSVNEGIIPAQSADVIALTEKLKAQLNHMSAEHQLIKAYMDEVIRTAARENHPEVISLANDISHHAAMEEQVYYPAAILLGEFLKLKRNEK